MRLTLLLPLCMAVASCGVDAPTPEQTPEYAPDPLASPATLPLQASEFPVLLDEDCSTVGQFYYDAIEEQDFERAALVWDDPVIDAARLAALFSDYQHPEFTPGETFEENAAGSLLCTLSAGLTDAGNLDRAPRQGTLTLRRADEVPGATPDQLRWTIEESTFIEPMERAGRGEPA